MTWSAWLLASSILLAPGDLPAVDVVSDVPAVNAEAGANEAACYAFKVGGVAFPMRVALRVWDRVPPSGKFVPRTYFIDIVTACQDERRVVNAAEAGELPGLPVRG